MKKHGLVITIVILTSLINVIPNTAHSQQETMTEERWQVFTEPSFGFQIEYPADWYAGLVVDNVNRAIDYDEHVALRSIGFFGPNSQIVFVDIWSNPDMLSLDEWTLRYPFYLDTDNQLTITTQEIMLNNSTGRQVTGTPRDELLGIVPLHYRTQFVQNGLVFSIEYDALSPDLDTYQTILNSFAFADVTRSQNEPSSLTDFPPPAEYGITAATCCGITDPEYNPFTCNTSGEGDCTSPPCGNCTWWARYARTGNNEANLYHCTHNANTWDECADQYYPHLRSDTPESNAVIVWLSINHVAYIEHMNSSSSYYVSQMGWSQSCPERYYNQNHDGSKYTYVRHPDNIDSTPPTISFNTPSANQWYATDQTLSWTVSDSESGVDYYKWAWDDSTPNNRVDSTNGSTTLSAEGQGQHTLYVQAWDNNGNVSAVESRGWFGYDTTAPSNPTIISSGCSAQNGVWQNTCNNTNFSWSGASDNLSTVAGYEYYWGPSSNGTDENFITGTVFDPDPVGEGTHYFRMRVKDGAGNYSLWTTIFILRYDISAPTGSMVINNDNITTYKTLVTLEPSASDNLSGARYIRFRDQGNAWEDWQGIMETKWVLPAFTGQAYTVEAEIADAAGNVSVLLSDEIVLDIYPDRPSSSGYTLSKSTFGMSSTNSTSSEYSLYGTLSQPSTIGTHETSNYKLASGFWSWLNGLFGEPEADLSIKKSVLTDPIHTGQTITYTLSIENHGPDEAEQVIVTDTLPDGATFQTATGTGWSCVEDYGTVTCTRSSLGVGTAPDIALLVTAPDVAGTIQNTASVTSSTADNDSTNNSDLVDVMVNPQADLALTKMATPNTVITGETVTYTLSVDNLSLNTAADVIVTDTLPDGVTFQSAIGTGWSCGEDSGTVTCTRSSLGVGTAPDITILVTAPETAGTIQNAASVTSLTRDDDPTNNLDTVDVMVNPQADLALTKDATPSPVITGETVTYTLSVENLGLNTAADIIVTDTLPDSVTFQTASGTGWNCDEVTGTVTCTRSSLGVGTAPDITILVTAPETAGTIQNAASVTSLTRDDDPTNNEGSCSVEVIEESIEWMNYLPLVLR